MIIQVHGGVKASTTGNVTGIYDMNGGTWEVVAGYVNNGSSSLTSYGNELLEAPEKHKNVYTAYNSNGEIITSGTDDQYKSYEGLKNIYGDAVWETSSTANNINGAWYNDYSYCPCLNLPFFARGGYNAYASSSGIFYFTDSYGLDSIDISFRPSVVVY